MNAEAKIIYRLNVEDEIVYVNEEWAKFASGNDAQDLLPERVLNRPLWDFVCDETTEHLYREIVRLARAGRPASFNFRCDAPGRRRLMEMRVAGLEGGAVQFETRTLSADDRPRQELLDRYAPRSGKMLRICGWCKRMDIEGERWGEVEDAVNALRLFEYNSLPRLTHGMCPPCYDSMSEKLADLRPADWRPRP